MPFFLCNRADICGFHLVFHGIADNIFMAKRKKKPDLFKKVLAKALLMYIREQIGMETAPASLPAPVN